MGLVLSGGFALGDEGRWEMGAFRQAKGFPCFLCETVNYRSLLVLL